MEERQRDRGQRLNWRQACEILGCGKNRFYRLVRTGKLPAYRLAGGRRDMWVYESDCRSLVECVPSCQQNGATL